MDSELIEKMKKYIREEFPYVKEESDITDDIRSHIDGALREEFLVEDMGEEIIKFLWS